MCYRESLLYKKIRTVKQRLQCQQPMCLGLLLSDPFIPWVDTVIEAPRNPIAQGISCSWGLQMALDSRVVCNRASTHLPQC